MDTMNHETDYPPSPPKVEVAARKPWGKPELRRVDFSLGSTETGFLPSTDAPESSTYNPNLS